VNQQILRVLISKWWLITLAILSALGASLIYSLNQAPYYTATTQVLIDLKSPDPVAGMILAGQLQPSYLSTQVDILKSRKVALKVVDNLKLADNPVAKADFEKRGTPGSIREALADFLVKNIEIKPAKESTIISIAYTGSEPRFAATVANAFARAYIETSLAMRADPARESASWFTTQTSGLKQALDQAQRKLTDYQRVNGIISNDERFDVENSRLQELSSQLNSLSVQTVDSTKRQSVAKESEASGSIAQVQEVLGNPLVQSLKSDINRLDSRLKEKAAVLGSGHPDIIKIEQELGSLIEKLKLEESRIVGSLGKGARINQQRYSELQAAYDRQRGKVLGIKQVRDDLQLLQKEYEAAQRAFDNVSVRLTQSNLESQAIQTNLSVLNVATAPLEAAGPQTSRNGVLAGVLGLVVGLMAALFLESINRKTRVTSDLVNADDFPVLGSIPKLPSARRIQRLAINNNSLVA
jgi:polysaccharide biosynthesis transport protein